MLKNVQEDHKAIYTGKKPLGMIGIVLGYGTSTYNPIESIAKAGSGIIAKKGKIFLSSPWWMRRNPGRAEATTLFAYVLWAASTKHSIHSLW